MPIHAPAGLSLLVALLLSACSVPAPRATVDDIHAETLASPHSAQGNALVAYVLANRLSWGASPGDVALLQAKGTTLDAYLRQQLHPMSALLPPAVQAQIDRMTISQRPVGALAQDMAKARKAAVDLTNDDEKKAALQAWQKEMTRLSRETASRHILRALYSPSQIQEQMTWFWMNHFSVYAYKGNIRATIADYEDAAVRPHALGKFRDLLGAVAHHPAMLVYLDNAQNVVGSPNENYARELMELHTLGVGSGYSQRDVQELARVMTGVGTNYGTNAPKLRPELQPYYVHQGGFVFNPARHDFGAKTFLGQPIHSRGVAEFDEVLDRLARAPATARFISRKLAVYWLQDDPSPALVERMAQTFLRSDGDIAATLQSLLGSDEFAQGAGKKFKDPMRYVISSVRLANLGTPVLDVDPLLNALNRMGEPLYGRQTPDGYSLASADWTSPGQMATRFEVAKAMSSGYARLLAAAAPQNAHRASPKLGGALYDEAISKTLSPATLRVLEQAVTPQEWNTFLLASPEWMNR